MVRYFCNNSTLFKIISSWYTLKKHKTDYIDNITSVKTKHTKNTKLYKKLHVRFEEIFPRGYIPSANPTRVSNPIS